jgi:anthranilate phosphoribosyltransferase
MANQTNGNGYVSITPLLKRLSTVENARKVAPEEIAAAVALIFTDSVSPVQFALLLWALHTTGQDHQPEVLAACAFSMRDAAAKHDVAALHATVRKKGKATGTYKGGLVWYARRKQPSSRRNQTNADVHSVT